MTAAIAHDLDSAAKRFRALADPKRLEILGLLSDGELCVCDIADTLRISQSLLSFHLRTLKDAGFVTDRRDGRWVHYSLADEALAEISAIVDDVRRGRRLPRAVIRCCS